MLLTGERRARRLRRSRARPPCRHAAGRSAGSSAATRDQVPETAVVPLAAAAAGAMAAAAAAEASHSAAARAEPPTTTRCASASATGRPAPREDPKRDGRRTALSMTLFVGGWVGRVRLTLRARLFFGFRRARVAPARRWSRSLIPRRSPRPPRNTTAVRAEGWQPDRAGGAVGLAARAREPALPWKFPSKSWCTELVGRA